MCQSKQLLDNLIGSMGQGCVSIATDCNLLKFNKRYNRIVLFFCALIITKDVMNQLP